MDQGDATVCDLGREKALAALNVALAREGLEAFYAEDRLCYLRHVAEHDCRTRHQSASPILGRRAEKA